jgi:hypothetical protein
VLQEFENVRQFDDEYGRFFRDDIFGLYVFCEYDGSCMSDFQLICDKDSLPGILSWNMEGGFHQQREPMHGFGWNVIQ